MTNRKVKSNRAQADYFELLVCQYICCLYGITFSYSLDLAHLSNQVLKLPEGKKRLKLQNDNLIKIQPKIKEILDYEIGQKGKIIKVIWTGRNFMVLTTTSDVDAEHITSKKTRFSVKSISESGTGTLKNLGARQIKRYLNIDYSQQYKQMWLDLKKYMKDNSSSQSELKKKIIKNDVLLKWATNNGRKYQYKLNNLCFNAFNNLSLEKKIDFINFILDADDEDLYVIIVNSNKVTIYKPKEKKLKTVKKIEAKDLTKVGYTIYINDVPVYRVQTNFTNGIGISAYCQRIFWNNLDKD